MNSLYAIFYSPVNISSIIGTFYAYLGIRAIPAKYRFGRLALTIDIK